MPNVFKSILLIAVSFCVTSLPARATDAEICDVRAAILGAAAQERDKGASRQKVKRMLGKNFSWMSGYIDLVYDQMKGMSTKEVAAFIKFSCSQE